MLRICLSFILGFLPMAAYSQNSDAKFPNLGATSLAHYPEQDGSFSNYFSVGSTADSNTTLIQYDNIVELCGDLNGCQVRIGLYDRPKPGYLQWLGTGMMSVSRDHLNYRWVATFDGDTNHGIAGDSNFERAIKAGPCELTDGMLVSGKKSDSSKNFGFHKPDHATVGYCIISFMD